MSENKTGVDKTSFAFGLVAGIAVISVVILLNQNFKSDGAVAGEVVKNDAAAVAPSQPSQPDAVAPAASVKPLSKDDHVKGDPNAKVVLIEYSDFQCPYCLRHNETMQQIADAYGDKIAIAFRHFPLTSIHPEAQKAAEASECAAEQGKFWEMHDKIFEANAAGNMNVAAWKQLAGTLGLKTEQFNSCLDSGKYAAKVRQDTSEGGDAGVQGTPATFVNGQLVSGAVPYDQFKQMIDGSL
jgi:protein-disulfide isomerase